MLKKSKNNNDVLFIDATKECVKAPNNNKLLPDNIKRILEVFERRENVEYFCKVASFDEIKGYKYNLSVSTYVKQEIEQEDIDIHELNKKIDFVVEEGNTLRKEVKQIISKIEEYKL